MGVEKVQQSITYYFNHLFMAVHAVNNQLNTYPSSP